MTNMPPSSSSSPVSSAPCLSVLETVFDVAVIGAGTIGFAAARALAGDGRNALLLESSGTLLWESALALENRAEEAGGEGDAWGEWLARISQIQCVNSPYFDTALVETMAANDLETTPGLSTLLYAMPVAATVREGVITAVTVATKAGPRQVVAKQWVDTTENGLLVRLSANANEGKEHPAASQLPSDDKAVSPRVQRHAGIVLQSADNWSGLPLEQMPKEIRPGAQWFASVRETERRLTWPVPETGARPLHEEILAVTRSLRQALGNTFLVSHCSQREYPIYTPQSPANPTATGTQTATTEVAAAVNRLPGNLLVLSPEYINPIDLDQPLATIAQRFRLGASAPLRLAALITLPESASSLFSVNSSRGATLPAPVEERTCQVLVAGTGTGGMLAALAAAGQGADTVAVDFSISPGGIATEGGITGYCHGMPGGLQQKLDELSTEYSELLCGTTGGFGALWHYMGKRLAVLTLFAESGVRFYGETILCGVEMDQNSDLSGSDSGAGADSGSDSVLSRPSRSVRAVLGAVDGRIVRFVSATYIDSTGDGDICAMAGADFDMGRSEDGVCLSYSQVGFCLSTTAKGSMQIRGRNYDAGYVDATDTEDLSRARLRGLAQYLRPAWTHSARPVAFGTAIGLRQSRQIRTDVTLTFREIIAGATFPDAIGGTMTFADTHAVDYEFESDQSLFYYWICQSFREPLRCELPYRILLPRTLNNVWIACRASGLSVAAAYAVRMQRDVQRIGEAAGIAAALLAREASGSGGTRLNSRNVNIPLLRDLLQRTGACATVEIREIPGAQELATRLQSGRAGLHLWHIYQQPDAWITDESGRPETLRAAVERLVNSPDPTVSFNSAAILAMWRSPLAERRLLSAVRDREPGPAPAGAGGKGAFGQDVDIPYWLSAVVLLRYCGTHHALPLLQDIAAEIEAPFNQRTCIALTLERLARREDTAQIEEIHRLLLNNVAEVAKLPPTRSLRRMMEGKEQMALPNEMGADTREDLTWQLHLVIARTRQALGLLPLREAQSHLADPRRYVRRAFTAIPSIHKKSPSEISSKKPLQPEPSLGRPNNSLARLA